MYMSNVFWQPLGMHVQWRYWLMNNCYKMQSCSNYTYLLELICINTNDDMHFDFIYHQIYIYITWKRIYIVDVYILYNKYMHCCRWHMNLMNIIMNIDLYNNLYKQCFDNLQNSKCCFYTKCTASSNMSWVLIMCKYSKTYRLIILNHISRFICCCDRERKQISTHNLYYKLLII